MGIILSLQGGMAAGKTTAARYVSQNANDIHVIFEDNSSVLDEVKRRGLDKTNEADFYEIQRLFIKMQCERFNAAAQNACTLFDLGADETEFYTLHYPATVGRDWDVKKALAPQLAALQKCMPSRILFIDASADKLTRNKNADETRGREFFEHSTKLLLPMKRAWYAKKPNTDFLAADNLTQQQLCEAVLKWTRAQMHAQ